MLQVPLGKYTEVKKKKKICWNFILERDVIFAMKERNTSGALLLQELVYKQFCLCHSHLWPHTHQVKQIQQTNIPAHQEYANYGKKKILALF